MYHYIFSLSSTLSLIFTLRIIKDSFFFKQWRNIRENDSEIIPLPIRYAKEIFVIILSDNYGSIDFYGASGVTLDTIKVSQIRFNQQKQKVDFFQFLTIGK